MTNVVSRDDSAAGFPIVGIGASAGGLAAFQSILVNMPPEANMAFVLIQHLPDHVIDVTTLFASHTHLKVVQVQNQMSIEANRVYVSPPHKNLSIKNCVLYLADPIQSHGMRLPIDFFFRSLAEDQRENALCVILSGNGADGSLGLKSVKESGGMVMVQSPETAEYDGMPCSAIATGMTDHIAPTTEMFNILSRHTQYHHNLRKQESSRIVTIDKLGLVLTALYSRTSYNFNCYKKGTIIRRVERRMGLNQFSNITDYAHFVQHDEYEASKLLNDLLISVTNFYRGAEAFQFLDKKVIQKLVQNKDNEESIRVWVPGCATGEEAYSIGILFLEQLTKTNKHCQIQIYASDISTEAIRVARTGVYPLSITADVSAERLQQFFEIKNQSYYVTKQLKEKIIFTVQDLINDPPFSGIDLISCRNLLIYIEPEIQRKIISLFHFILYENGFLFLGCSETIGQKTDLFRATSKRFRLYQRTGVMRHHKFDFPFAPNLKNFDKRALSIKEKLVEPINLETFIQQALLDKYVPFAVLINYQCGILYFYGQSGPYLELTTGKPTQNLLSTVREGIGYKLRAAIQAVAQNKQAVKITAQTKRSGDYHSVVIEVSPIKIPRITEELMIVTFVEKIEAEQIKPKVNDEAYFHSESLVNQLETELSEAKDNLRSNLEEIEAANVELMTSNEEILSMNEELQSANEELETTKEELQSMNEELETVNNQLQDKVRELATANDDLANLFSSTRIASLFLDVQFCIKRFTPATCHLFKLISSDVGRSIGDISHRFLDLNLRQNIETVLKNLTSLEKEMYTEDGECFILRMMPFLTNDNTIDGVVVTFIDVSHLKAAEASLAKSKERTELLLQSTGEAIYGVDNTGCCIFINNRFTEQLGFTTLELIGNNAHNLINYFRIDGSQFPWEESFVYLCLHDGTSYRNKHDIAWRKDGTSFPVMYSVEPIIEEGNITGAVIILRDITDEKAISSKLDYLAKHDSLTGLINRREFEERLRRIIDSAKQDKTEHILCYLDLDQFKVINDTCGHLAGDELLRQVTGMLGQKIRKRDTLARLGGDEFGVLMEHCDWHKGECAANNMRDAVANYRFLWDNKAHVVGVSIGVVSITQDSGDITEMLKAADAACYAAKESGRNRIHLYREQDIKFAERYGEMQWVGRINQALEKKLLRLALQPIVPINGIKGNNVFYEVLLRIQEEDGNIILARDFLGAAERYDLATKLDRWVVCRILKWYEINKRKLANVSLINVNLSGQSLGDKDFLDFVIMELKINQIPPETICFEITETAAITNLSNANHFMHTLKQLGCLFALDDFGTGLSSFGYLKALPVEYLKVPGLFVKDILNNPIDFAMVKSINEIGQVMGKKTIAESVESDDILEALNQVGVNYAQGYVIGKPVFLDDMIFT